MEQLSNPKFDDADVIILGGVASYIEPDIFYGKIIPAIWMLLKPGGVLFFDIQTDTPCYRHSMDILGWQTFALPKDPATVMATVEEAKKKLWKNSIRFGTGYAVDTYNKTPSAVMVTLTKC